ncbi:hypothetical protein ACWIUD_12005, partial [Helicobacter sp. 23-1044]
LKTHKISLPFNAINHAKYLSNKMGIAILNIAFNADCAEITLECDDMQMMDFARNLQGAKCHI